MRFSQYKTHIKMYPKKYFQVQLNFKKVYLIIRQKFELGKRQEYIAT